MKTVLSFANDSDLTYLSPIMEHRLRNMMFKIKHGFNCNKMINTYIKRYYKPAKDFELFVYVIQVMQTAGIKFTLETHYCQMTLCMGSMYWQIKDCRHNMSWSSVDYFRSRKTLYYFSGKVQCHKSEKLAKNAVLKTSAEIRFSNNHFDILPGRTYQINFIGKSNYLDKELKIITLNQIN